jgi:hypothetical protein
VDLTCAKSRQALVSRWSWGPRVAECPSPVSLLPVPGFTDIDGMQFTCSSLVLQCTQTFARSLK